MSIQAARSFYELLEVDPVLTQRVLGGPSYEAEVFVRDEFGFDFTPDELRRVIAERNPALSEEEMAEVVAEFSTHSILPDTVVGCFFPAAYVMKAMAVTG